MRVPLPPQRYPDAPRRIAFFQDLLRTRRAVCRAWRRAARQQRAASAGQHVEQPSRFRARRRPPIAVQIHNVSAGYTDAMGIRLAAGRLLTESDVDRVAAGGAGQRTLRARAVDRSAAARPDRPASAPGTAAVLGAERTAFRSSAWCATRRTPASPNRSCRRSTFPFTAAGMSNLLIVRTHGDPAGVTRAVVSQVYAIDKGQPVTGVHDPRRDPAR